MQTIVTKYLGPTTYKDSRIKAGNQDGLAVTIPLDNSLNADHNHRKAAAMLADKLWGPNAIYQGGYIKVGGNSYMVWVPIDDMLQFTTMVFLSFVTPGSSCI